ncbi:MAG: nucleotidyltransferase domain-containing protein [Euryarchaeota archaeon]|nr:nucleotidyltransferase domain-containing protein [Euryarchaeota archaeon]MDE1835629.1 nucleotidyltransferase domain-containing protein [Euryarchaeota archaeon]MDE1878977.1 nucleotidyltransferase domain-containing protein [Euryarchaeota archaeon]MDE2043749.1 nucleotidyltransferase domain-containing protein [Thermoplasmata archaeon]
MRGPPDQLKDQEHRVRTLLQVAAMLQTAIAPDDLIALLPEGPVRTSEDLKVWLSAHPGTGSFEEDRVRPAGTFASSAVLEGRRAVAEEQWKHALEELPEVLGPSLGLVRCVVVTGSVAYGEAADESDLDLFVITRRGALWPFLLYVYAALRFHPRAGGRVWCFNHVVDEDEVERYLASRRGVLEARELLVARPVVGEAFYRQFLASTPWVQEALPRLYARWRLPTCGRPAPAHPAPVLVRLLNLVGFPLLATYLQLKGTWISGRQRRMGRTKEAFRSVTGLRKFFLLSGKFDQLRQTYARDRGQGPTHGDEALARPRGPLVLAVTSDL